MNALLCLWLITLILLVAGVSKIKHLEEFKANLELSFYVPSSVSLYAALAVIGLELALAISLHIPKLFLWASTINLVLFLGFLCISLYGVLGNTSITCNCYGKSRDIGAIDVLSHSVLLFASMYIVAQPPSHHEPLVHAMAIILGAAMALCVINLPAITRLSFGRQA